MLKLYGWKNHVGIQEILICQIILWIVLSLNLSSDGSLSKNFVSGWVGSFFVAGVRSGQPPLDLENFP